MGNRPYLSIVVPFYNEEDAVEELYSRLKKVLEEIKKPYELIFINDGSKDRTPDILSGLFDKDPLVNVIHLTTNFGQTAALAAGFDAAGGDIIISMDGDLQHFPEEIPLFLEKIDEGYDIVSGWRKKRVDNLLLRKIPSRSANWMMSKLSGVEIHDFGTTFKAYRSEVIKSLELYGDLHRFIPALASARGISIIEIPITNVVRGKGKSKYGLGRVQKVFFDLITVKFLISFIDKPLQIFGPLGFIFAFAGTFIGLLLTVLYFMGRLEMKENLGNLMFAVLLVLLGLNFITTGILAEVSSRIYFKVHEKRPYVVRKKLSHGTD